MKVYNFKNPPMSVFGSPLFYKSGKLERLPDEMARIIEIDNLRKRNPGARVCFRTNAPDATYAPDDERRAIIRRTNENAIARGDINVYFIDGESYFDGEYAYRCFVDTIHPNDYGFSLMAKRIQRVIEQILSKFPE